MTSQSKPDGFAGSPNRGNDFDRRQWRKQGEIVGAAASGMQTRVKQPRGAATRVRSTLGISARPTLDEQSSIYREQSCSAA